jgi:hypothetical protein
MSNQIMLTHVALSAFNSVPSRQTTVINFASIYWEYLNTLLQQMISPILSSANEAANSAVFTVTVLVLLTVVNQETDKAASSTGVVNYFDSRVASPSLGTLCRPRIFIAVWLRRLSEFILILHKENSFLVWPLLPTQHRCRGTLL